MKIEKLIEELSHSLSYEHFETVKKAKSYLKYNEISITGKQVIEQLKQSRYWNIFKEVINNIQEDKLYQESFKHGVDHNLRTSILAGYIGINEALTEKQFRMVIEASIYHDIGRKDDENDYEHGIKSSQKLEDLNLKEYSQDEVNILKAMTEAHCIDDKYMLGIFSKYGIKDLKIALKLTNILKDADALDRVRLIGGVDKDFLRTKISKKLIPASDEIYANINSIDGMKKDNWIDLKEYINMMISPEYSKFRKKQQLEIKKMSYEEQEKFIERLQGKGKNILKKVMSENIKIGTKMFNNREEAYNFCNRILETKNMEVFLNIKGQRVQNQINVNEQGKLILEEGTYVHGIDFNEKNLMNIKSEGLIAPAFRENVEDTIYPKSLCVFRVDKTQSLEEYYKGYNTFSEESAKKPRHNKILCRNGKYIARPEEAGFLPTESLGSRIIKKEKLAFIINPNVFTGEFWIDKLYKGHQAEYERGYEIPIGLPPNLISGIMPSRDLLEDKGKIEKLKQIFPDKYIATPDGEILYSPENIQTVNKCLFSEKEIGKTTINSSKKEEAYIRVQKDKNTIIQDKSKIK